MKFFGKLVKKQLIVRQTSHAFPEEGLSLTGRTAWLWSQHSFWRYHLSSIVVNAARQELKRFNKRRESSAKGGRLRRIFGFPGSFGAEIGLPSSDKK
jgi:hypothetical protein